MAPRARVRRRRREAWLCGSSVVLLSCACRDHGTLDDGHRRSHRGDPPVFALAPVAARPGRGSLCRSRAMGIVEAPGTSLLERSEELTRIEAALARARSGAGSFVVVEGPAGI